MSRSAIKKVKGRGDEFPGGGGGGGGGGRGIWDLSAWGLLPVFNIFH